MRCLMAEDALISEQEAQSIAAAHVDRRAAMLREKGITDEKTIQRLSHSGRNGLILYLKSNSYASIIATAASQGPSTLATPTATTMSSGATPSLIQTIQALGYNLTDTTSTQALISTLTIAAQAAQSASISVPKKPTQV